MDVYLETDLAGIPRNTWNDLVSQSTTNTVFQTYEWHVAWWKAFGADKTAFIVCVRDGGQLIGFASLMLHDAGGQPRTLSLMGSGRSDYLDFVYPGQRPQVIGEIVKFLRDRRRLWDLIELRYIPDYSATAQSIMTVSSSNGLYCLRTETVACPTMKFAYDSAGNVQNLIRKKSLARHHSYFLKRGGYRVQHLTDAAAIAGYLDSFFDQHVARWSVTDTPSLFLDDRNRAFYRELVSTMSPTAWLVFTVIESLERPVAFHFGFAYANRFLWYKPSFEVSLAKRSPGEALLKELLDYAVARRLDEFDFTVGDEPFKLRFADQVRYNQSYRILKTRRRFLIGWAVTGLKMKARKMCMGRSLTAPFRRFRESQLPVAREAIRKHGLASFAWRVTKRLFKRLVFEYACVLFFEIPAGRTVEEQDDVTLAGVTVREARIEDLLEFEYSDYESVRSQFVKQVYKRFKRYDRCFMAEYSGKPVYVAWAREEVDTYVTEVRTWVSIGPNAVNVYDGMTVPALRNKGLGRFTLSRALNILKDKRRIAYCWSYNKPAERYMLRCGFQLVQRYYLLRILGIPARWHADVLPKATEI